MNKKEKSTIRKLKNKKYEGFLLIIRGIETGIAAGLVCVLFRFLLSKAEEYLYTIIDAVKGRPLISALWICALAAMGILVALFGKQRYTAGNGGNTGQNLAELVESDSWQTVRQHRFRILRPQPRQRRPKRAVRRHGGKRRGADHQSG